jgi:hypothetical protein
VRRSGNGPALPRKFLKRNYKSHVPDVIVMLYASNTQDRCTIKKVTARYRSHDTDDVMCLTIDFVKNMVL